MQEIPADGLQNATRAELIARIRQLESDSQKGIPKVAARQPNFIHTIFNSLPIGVAYVDRNQIYQFANELYRKMQDNPTDAIIGMALKDVLEPATFKVAQIAVEKVLSGTPVSFEDPLTQDGKQRYLNVSYLPDRVDNGDPGRIENNDVAGFYVLVQDVTTQHILQNELQGSENKYQSLVDAVPHGIEEIDTEGFILFANATDHEQYGYAPGELIGTNICETEISTYVAEQLKLNLVKLVEEQPKPEPYTGQKVKKNGDIIDVQVDWTYKKDGRGSVIGFIAIISDITEQLKLAQIQRQAADQLELCLKSANIGTFSWNIRDNTSFWDDRMHDIWGLPRSTFSNHLHDDFMKTIHPEDRKLLDVSIAKTIDEDALYHIEYRIIRPNGKLINVEALASLSRDEQGAPVQLNGVCLDISERKAIESMKSEFVSTVSHELRTPLTSIRGALGLVLGGAVGEIPETALDIIHMAAKNATSLTKLVNDILDFERADSGMLEIAFKNIELVSFLEMTLLTHQGLADEYHVKFKLTCNEPRIELEADRDRLGQVLANLLSNAAKYSPDGGVIDIDVHADTTHVVVSVCDRGPGIPEEFQDEVFNRFTQASASDDRKFGGAGLGLSITKLIIECHQGEIDFATAPESGTTFRFKLPRHQTKT